MTESHRVRKMQTQRERGRGGREIFQALIHFPNPCNSQGCAGLRPGVRSPIQISHVVTGTLGLWPSSCCLPDTLAGSCVRSRASGT